MVKKTKHFSLRIDEELLRRFDYVSKYEDRSMNWTLLRLIRQYVDQFEKKHGKIVFPKDTEEAQEGAETANM